MVICHSSAQLAICQHKILGLELFSGSVQGNDKRHAQQLNAFKGELRTAAAAVTYIVQDLLLLDLAQYLPISA